MKSAQKLRLLCLFFLVPVYALAQPVDVSLPDANGDAGTSVEIPILVGDITGRNVLSFSAVVSFDDSVLEATGASSTGTLSEPFGVPVVDTVDNLISVSLSGPTPLSGSGTLINLQFDVIGEPGETSPLDFIFFRFNVGTPEVETSNGLFTVNVPQEPDIQVVPDTLDFGDVPIDSTAEQTLTVTNIGSAPLNITDGFIAGTDASEFDFEMVQFPFSLAPDESMPLVIRFTPTFSSLKNASFEIVSNDPDEPQVSVPLTGTGIALGEPDIATSQDAIEFGGVNLNTTENRSLFILNEGSRELMIETLDFSGTDAPDFTAKIQPLPFGIMPGDSQSVLVGFRPSSASMKTAEMQIMSNDPDEALLRLPVSGQGVIPPQVTVSFLSPEDGATVCGDETDVTASVQIRDGFPPLDLSCEINGVTTPVSQDSTFSATVRVTADTNFVTARCRVTDGIENEASDTDTLRLLRPQPPVCAVEIIAPADSLTVDANSIEVTAEHTVLEGTPPFQTVCEINGVAAIQTDSIFRAEVPLNSVETLIVVTCVTSDSCETQTVCRDSIRVFRSIPICEVDILQPENEEMVCESQLEVEAELQILNAAFPVDVACDINGVEAQLADSLLTATVPLEKGHNKIVASCVVTDAEERTTICMDSVKVFLDRFKPNCSYEMEKGEVVGVFFDEHSGIKNIEPVDIRNANLIVESFSPGAQKVKFRIVPIDKNRDFSFSIDVTDVCGNTFNCDPVFLTLIPGTTPEDLSFHFPSRERYLQIKNFGLDEIRIELNGSTFLLRTAESPELPITTYTMPESGEVTFDLIPYLLSDQNHMSITFEGDENASAELILSDQAETVDHILDIKDIPTDFALAQNYPNPFNAGTDIRFNIPQSAEQMVRVRLHIYNLKGELVQRLIDDNRMPGTYTIRWDGTDRAGAAVSSGIYIYNIEAGDFRRSRRMLLLK